MFPGFCSPASLFPFLFLTVVVLLLMVYQGSSSGGNRGSQASGEGFDGWRPWWRKREREERGSASSRNEGGRVVFLLILDPILSTLRPWKSNLFIEGRRGTFCFFWCQISALGSTPKYPNHWFKVAMMNCQFCAGKWLVGLVILGRCHRLWGLNQPERFTLACSQVVSGHFYLTLGIRLTLGSCYFKPFCQKYTVKFQSLYFF